MNLFKIKALLGILLLLACANGAMVIPSDGEQAARMPSVGSKSPVNAMTAKEGTGLHRLTISERDDDDDDDGGADSSRGGGSGGHGTPNNSEGGNMYA